MGLLEWLGWRRRKTCGTDGCGYYVHPIVGDPDLCMLCRLSMHLKDKDIRKMTDDPRFPLLPKSMGFPEEEWHDETKEHGPHYTCVVNGVRVCVWVDHDGEKWHVQYASSGYFTRQRWLDRVENNPLYKTPIISTELALLAIIYDMTSGGNNEQS
jgi:hypothetical protein